jgi:GDP-mannose 6-dehydrogenase
MTGTETDAWGHAFRTDKSYVGDRAPATSLPGLVAPVAVTERASVSIFGLGYVGAVSAVCFAHRGHPVIGVDINENKVDQLAAGEPPIIEKDMERLLVAGVNAGRITATVDVMQAVLDTDISIVCVGTPSSEDGNLNVNAVEAVCRQIGAAIAEKDTRHTVVIRSTVLPGTIESLVIPTLEEASGKQAGRDFGVAHNPEFLREGTAIADFFSPPKTVIGATDPETEKLTASLYEGLNAPLLITSLRTTEMVKYVDNVWHALKVAFGNEIGNICKALGIDSHEVMDIFCQDRKLNISPYYLKPGFAFGGSCLPKDTRALNFRARQLSLNLPIISSIMESNRLQVERAVKRVIAERKSKVSILGFSFKAGTDDLRESPQLELIERLIGKGYDIKLYDKNVQLAALTGANKDYVLRVMPHIASLLSHDIDEALAHAEIVIIGNSAPEFDDVPSQLRPDQLLIDLVGLKTKEHAGDQYDGINW